ncbi:hypothetical protein ACOTI2_08270 [Achromobacter xylosoxidans]|jgi:hypothetical protein|uniref:hypothetical protein n=1 Tax=Alcaligenes xylosoxydans xylosoxydans TaxID=85698 RepID=UPI0008A27092|nr:hypothetical protein [Achromobacter xylosoxidans]OFL37490.1 hypothetical protein HMPREF2772_27185 [Achromobacter xylosoxidans]
MDWKFFLGLMIPAVGAAFVWLTKVAREDPPLFAEIDSVLSRWIPTALFAVSSMAIFSMVVWNDGRKDVLIISAILVFALLQLRSAFPFFRRVAALPRTRRETPSEG